MTKTLISVVGPTAIGKTAKSIGIAQELQTEIISADSRQFYKEMNIGTAVPSPEELKAVPHHFIQHISVDDAYDVGDFEKDALKKLNILFKKNDFVVMVGGSGLYVKAVSEGLDEFPPVDPKVREALNELFAKEGIRPLQERLQEADPEYAAKADMHNPRRIIRALEVYLSSGKPFSSFLNQKKMPRPFKTIQIGLKAPRQIIYERIEQRVDIMIESGLLKEAESLYPQRHKNALNTIGYKELYNYLDGDWSLDFAISEIKKNTRRFAKRQLTWFRKSENIHWFSYKTPAREIVEFILSQTSE